jgi:hypothetical protein
MEPMYYIGLDVHKRKISYCVKGSGGKVYAEGSLPATPMDLDLWMKTLPQPWSAAMEATMFTGWKDLSWKSAYRRCEVKLHFSDHGCAYRTCGSQI